MNKPMHKVLHALAAGLLATSAAAHDTWFEPRPGGALALGTGNQFPVMETGIGAAYVTASGCEGGALAVTHEGEQALLLQPPAGSAGCWLQLQPFDVELPPALVDVYLREVRPPPAVVEAWRAMQARGLPWRERYTKHARIAFKASAAEPVPMGMDVLMPAPGRFQLLRDGQPLPHFNVELRHERARLGIWRSTDAEGRLAVPLSLPGRWLLRAIDLRVVDDRFESRFVTLAFEVPQKGMNSSPNARSANQAPATAAMSSEPPSSTPRR